MPEIKNATERREFLMDFFQEKLVVNPDHLYKARNGDLIVIGPPKSGTTWMQQILHQMRTKGDENFDDIYEITWHISHPQRQYEFNFDRDQKFNPRVFKCHEAYGVIETTEKQKFIVIVRDPYDAAYSFSKFIDGFFGGDEEISEESLREMMLTLHEQNTSGNFTTISTWWQHRDDPNVLFLFYEDLKKDLKAVVRKISEFVEIPMTEEELNRVLYFCSFEYMAQHKEKFQGESLIEILAQFVGIEKWKPTVGMIRTDGGKIGQGLDNMGPELKAMVSRLWEETIEKQTGFKCYQDMYDHKKNL